MVSNTAYLRVVTMDFQLVVRLDCLEISKVAMKAICFIIISIKSEVIEITNKFTEIHDVKITSMGCY